MGFSPLLERKKLRLLLAFHRKTLLIHHLDDLLAILGKEIKQILRAERVTVFLLDAHKNELFARYAMGMEPATVATLHFPITQGIAGYVARTGQTLNARNPYKDSHFDPRFDKLYGFRTKTAL